MTSPVDPYRSPRNLALWFPLRTDDVLYLRPRALLNVPPEHAHNDLAPLSTNSFDGFVYRAGVVWGLRRVRAPLHGRSGPERLERWSIAHRLRPFAEFVPEVSLYEGLRAPGATSPRSAQTRGTSCLRWASRACRRWSVCGAGTRSRCRATRSRGWF